MARLVLGATGSVAAIKVPLLAKELVEMGHDVRVVATEASLYFFDPDELPRSASGEALPFYRDADEWPGQRYSRGDEVLHIELRRWAEVLLVAPVDAHTLAKFALGLSDNLLACLYRAWEPGKPVVMAPAMNTLMWQKPATRRHFQMILEDHALAGAPSEWALDQVDEVFAKHSPGVVVVPPVSKTLACGDQGVGALADAGRIALAIQRLLVD